MADFIKIGTTRVNLDNVNFVEEGEEPYYPNGDQGTRSTRPFVRAYFNHAVSDGYEIGNQATAWIRFNGDEARLLLAWIDGDDEQVDTLYQHLNGKSEPEIVVALTTAQVEALGGAEPEPDLPLLTSIDF